LAKLLPLRHKGNDSLFLAVEMSLISTLAGIPLHIHAEGLRGTGKTTVMRCARHRVPRISRIKDCPYHCEPESPHCPLHRDQGTASDGMVEEVPMPFFEIGHGAKLGTILGSIDLEKLTDSRRPQASLMPGTIPMANRGIIFIDEVNRLAETAPEITDVLLSVMGTKPGCVKVEEVGLRPFEIEVSSSVWATSNPDEDPGPLEDIRRQLADRFDLVVPVQRPGDASIVERILARKSEVDSPEEVFLGDAAQKAAKLADVVVPKSIVKYLAHLYIHKNVESLRAVEALELSSRLAALIAGKVEVSLDELALVIPLVLRHRVEPLTLSEILKDLELRRAAGSRPGPEQRETPGLKSGPTTPGAGPDHHPYENPDGHSKVLSPAGLNDGPEGARGEKQRATSLSFQEGEDLKERAKPSLLQRALARYRASLRERFGPGSHSKATSTPSSSLPGSPSRERSHGTDYLSASGVAGAPPISPGEPARRLSSLPWDHLVTPPDWQDGWR
jgi:magnesium chelatase subunit I